MKIAFFDTKSYWKDSFEPMAKKYGYDITFFNERLTPATAHLAAGHDATCSFVNDEVPAEVIRELKNLGIKVLLLRCAGFDSVDLEVAKECGLPVLRVPAYSPESVAEQGAALLMAVNRKPHLRYRRPGRHCPGWQDGRHYRHRQDRPLHDQYPERLRHEDHRLRCIPQSEPGSGICNTGRTVCAR